MIRVPVEHEFPGVLDGDQSLVRWNFPDQSLRPGGLAGAGGAGDEDVLAAADREAHEGRVIARGQRSKQRFLGVIGPLRRTAGAPEDPATLQIVDAPNLVRGAPNGDGDALRRRCRRHDDLHPLAPRKGRGEQGLARIDTLLSGIGDQLRESQTPIEVRLRQCLSSPSFPGFHVRLVRTVDAKLRDLGIGQQVLQGAERQRQCGGRCRRRGRPRMPANGRRRFAAHRPT
jgi:hypothetical protein